jgi:hypothetical protein
LHDLLRTYWTQQRLQFLHLARKLISSVRPASKCTLRVQVRTRRPPETQINPAGVKRFKGSELFSDDQGSVVGQHDPARANSDFGCSSGYVSYDDGSCCTGDANHVVMLGHPKAVISPLLGVDCEVSRVALGLIGRASIGDRRKVEN